MPPINLAATLYVWIPPVSLDAIICLDVPLYVGMPPYVWMPPIFGHPLYGSDALHTC